MKQKRKSGSMTIGMFAEGTARGIEQEITAIDLQIVEAAHNITKRRELLIERTRLERKLEAVQHLTKGT